MNLLRTHKRICNMESDYRQIRLNRASSDQDLDRAEEAERLIDIAKDIFKGAEESIEANLSAASDVLYPEI